MARVELGKLMASRKKIKIEAPTILHIVIDVDRFDVPTKIHFMGTLDARDVFGDLPLRRASGIKEVKDKCSSDIDHNGPV